jgi:hypothetical protein
MKAGRAAIFESYQRLAISRQLDSLAYSTDADVLS